MPDLKQTYNQFAENYNIEHRDMEDVLYPVFNDFISFISSKCKILDLGCGIGRDAKYFTDKKYTVIGFDFSEEMLKYARKNAPKAQFFISDMLKDDFGKNEFDAVLANSSLLHIPKKNIDQILQKIYTCLKPNGILLARLKAGKGESEQPHTINGKKIMRFFAFYSKKEFSNQLTKNHFKLLKITSDFSKKGVTWLNFYAQKI